MGINMRGLGNMGAVGLCIMLCLCLSAGCRGLTGLDELQFDEHTQASQTCRDKITGLDDANIFADNERCYGLVFEPGTWQTAGQGCEQAGMQLASLAGADELAALAAPLMNYAIDTLWIGGHFKGTGWTWDSNEPWTSYPCTTAMEPACDNMVKPWQAMQPDGSGFCLSMSYENVVDPGSGMASLVLRFDDSPCDVSMPYFCELAP